jgi:hypothetical protein
LKLILTPLATVTLAVLLGGGPVLAATGECRFIQARKERNACYEREAAAKKAAPRSGSAKMSDTIDQMKVDDDRLTKRLQGICKGC